MPWPIDDPAPDRDLPSDVEFGAWLESLHPSVVLRDLEPALTYPEKARLAYFRRKLLRSARRSNTQDPYRSNVLR